MATISSIIDQSQISNNCDLCNQVLKKLDQDYISHPLKDELVQAKRNLNEAILHNFKYHIIVSNIMEFLETKTINNSLEISSSRKSDKHHSGVSHPLYLHLVKENISSEFKNVELFGITEDFVTEVLNSKRKSQADKEELNKFIEHRIEDFCIKISSYLGYKNAYKNTWKKQFKEAANSLFLQCDSLALTDVELSSHQAAINEMRCTYFKGLLQGVLMLKKLLFLYQKKMDFESLLGTMYSERVQVLSAKVTSLEFEIMKATYNKKSVLALKIIREQLEEKQALLENQLNKTKSDVESYDVLGPQYEALVKEYTDLSNSIQQQQWAIDSLKRRQSIGSDIRKE